MEKKIVVGGDICNLGRIQGSRKFLCTDCQTPVLISTMAWMVDAGEGIPKCLTCAMAGDKIEIEIPEAVVKDVSEFVGYDFSARDLQDVTQNMVLELERRQRDQS